MRVDQLLVENFRSYRHIDVALRPFNVVLGQNASGKSSFIDVLRFLRDISRHGLDNAVSMQGGTGFLRNLCSEASEPLRIRVSLKDRYEMPLAPVREGRRTVHRSLVGDHLTYDFSIHFNSRGDGYWVLDDSVEMPCQMSRSQRVKGKWESHPEPGTEGRILARVRRQRLQGKFMADSGADLVNPDELMAYPFFRLPSGAARPLLLELPYLPFLFSYGQGRLADVAVYDFDPKLPKRAVPVTGRRQLEEDGSNLAIVLDTILRDKEDHERFLNLVKFLLPFVVDMDVERVAGRSFLLRLRETFVSKTDIPATFLSDGTITVLALIVGIAFEKRPIVVLEEPERNIHPGLMSKILWLIHEAVSDKQVVLTTHNPEVVRHVDVSDVLLTSRGPDGVSEMTRPSEGAEVRAFLDNEIGLSEVFVNDLWGSN